ncbi:hypothetical protein F8388_013839 [Cannabis sativa]|uniref:GDSL esterase/lipase n=1 Tax=Cannabis sativa TaxID=3483 RepID=A0A7J6EAQ5_CANSA|nr:hypothetical protein F8388_013839 [Cannabis sativa]
MGGGLERNCYDEENQVAIMFNSNSLHLWIILQNTMLIMMQDLPILISTIHSFMSFKTLLNMISKKGCCGTGLIEAATTCNSLDKTCVDANDYVFWDAYHPTEKAYKIIVKDIIKSLYELFGCKENRGKWGVITKPGFPLRLELTSTISPEIGEFMSLLALTLSTAPKLLPPETDTPVSGRSTNTTSPRWS